MQGNCGSLLDLEATYSGHRRVSNKGGVASMTRYIAPNTP